MNASDIVRIATGVAAATAAAATVFFFTTRQPAPVPSSRQVSPSVMLAAAEAGMDLTNSNPVADRDRLLAVFNAGQTRPWDTLEFRNGVYADAESGELVSSYAAATFDDGSPRLIACIVDGKIQGPTVEFHPNGELKSSLSFVDGRPVSQMIEYFEDGSLKLRAMASEDSDNGGTRVGEITVGFFDDGEYQRRNLGQGRIQFINETGNTDYRNQDTPLDVVAGWMLFNEQLIGGENIYTSDSRRIEGPATADDAQATVSDPDAGDPD
ncbi:MAG: hypothetical protein AAF747_06585 [Planctomycetota bacterium]